MSKFLLLLSALPGLLTTVSLPASCALCGCGEGRSRIVRETSELSFEEIAALAAEDTVLSEAEEP
jgi:hypothetical protein